MKNIFSAILVSVMLLGSTGAMAAEKAAESAAQKTTVKQEFKNNFKFYGFIRNYFTYDQRETVSGTGNLFNYMPKDQALNANGEDMNAVSSFRFLALTSRLGVDVSGYQWGSAHFGAKVEGDFYSGLSGSTGTAAARLRQAYVTIGWKDLPMAGEQKANVSLKIGQAWHPMAADFPDVFSLENGAPFGPFSRTPQVTMAAGLGKNWIITGSAIWQQQYTSMGPAGSSADYIKYSLTPEAYAGVTYKNGGFVGTFGVDMLSIKPRTFGEDPKSKTKIFVDDRITTVSAFAFLQYSKDKFRVKAKTILAQAGEHMTLNSGYAKVAELEDGSWEYAPIRNSSSWMSLSYGKKWQGVLFLGYVKNLGLANEAVNTPEIYFSKNSFSNMNQMYRINPEVLFNAGKFTLGLEYQWTAVQYGDNINKFGLAKDNLRWIGSSRIQSMIKFTF